MAEADVTPTSPKSGAFTTVFRGYDQVQVDEHLKKLNSRLEQTSRSRDDATASVADLTKALGHAQQELVETKAALTRMAEEPTGPAAMSERVKTMMTLAEEEIAELRRKAEEEADATRSAADSYADKTREEARSEADRLAEEAERERARLDEKAAQQRGDAQKASQEKIKAAEKKSTEEIASTKAEAEKAANELAEDARNRAGAMIAEAEARLSDAKDKHVQALELRRTVADRLAASNTALSDALDKLGSEPEPLEWATFGSGDAAGSASTASSTSIGTPAHGAKGAGSDGAGSKGVDPSGVGSEGSGSKASESKASKTPKPQVVDSETGSAPATVPGSETPADGSPDAAGSTSDKVGDQQSDGDPGEAKAKPKPVSAKSDGQGKKATST